VGFLNRDERASRRELRDAARRRLDDAVDSYIQRARKANAAGDIAREEKILAAGARWAATADKPLTSVTGQLLLAIDAEVEAGRLRSAYLGFAGDLHFYKDRIIGPEGVRLMDQHVRATVDSGGSIQRTQRPTLTRMAIGSILPGTALIPGLAMPKTEIHDDRELYLLVEHTEWARLIKLHANHGEQARTVAAAINQAARELGAKRAAEAEAEAADTPAQLPAIGEDTVTHLAKLAELHAAGALNDAEFAQAKSRILAA
jgi:hypothetical protein